MLINGSKLIGFPVLSLHTGGPIAKTTHEIINPDDLKIVAFKLIGPQVGGEFGDILEPRSVREFAPGLGMIVDSSDEFVFQEDVIKLNEVIKQNFSLQNIKVVTKKNSNLGRVMDFTVDTEDFRIAQLIIRRPFLKSFIDSELIISTSQIVEVSDHKIIVKEDAEKHSLDNTDGEFMPNFVNPFREPNFSPANSQNPDELNKR